MLKWARAGGQTCACAVMGEDSGEDGKCYDSHLFCD